ncbi:MAG: nitroreductase family protein [Calditrichaeota bacterium]|nr:nitroreductase family protein [Calditrichota bacterium]
MTSKFIQYAQYVSYQPEEMLQRSKDYYDELRRRRSIRTFSDKRVDKEIIENCIRTAGTAPSGANLQPWHFVAVNNKELKKEIRLAAEKEEYEFYTRRASDEWLADLQPFETNEKKPFLEEAPWLIAIFEKRYGINPDGSKKKHYYTSESVGIACGLLISAIHHSGLASLTHTPSPMGFLNTILDRPSNEKPFLLLVVGYPAEGINIPDIKRKGLNEIATFLLD